jgi:hypothetical protein
MVIYERSQLKFSGPIADESYAVFFDVIGLSEIQESDLVAFLYHGITLIQALLADVMIE